MDILEHRTKMADTLTYPGIKRTFHEEVVDETLNEDPDESITCSVCLDVFKNPKVLSCGHSFCLEPCLTKLTGATVKRSKKFHCPLCRSKVSLPKSGNASDLPTNFSLQAIIESSGSFKKQKRKHPEQHTHITEQTAGPNCHLPTPAIPCSHLQEAQFFCEKCQEFMCPECAANWHSDFTHSLVAKDVGLERARQRSEDLVTDAIQSLRKKIENEKKLLNETNVNSLSYEYAAIQMEMQVKASMSNARKLIDEKEKKYLEELSAQSQVDKTNFESFVNRCRNEIQKDQAKLDSILDTLSRVQRGDLTTMSNVMELEPIDVHCRNFMVEKNVLSVTPRFTWVDNLPHAIPKMVPSCDQFVRQQDIFT